MKLPPENQRIKDIINYYYKGNQLKFSREVGISQPRINRLFKLNSRNNKYPSVSSEINQAIINKFIDVNPIWLLTGEGEMIKKEEEPKRPSNSSFEKLSIEEKLNALMNLVVENKKKIEDLKETNKRIIEDFRKENRDNQQKIYDSVTTIETRQSIDNSFIIGVIKSTLFREMEERENQELINLINKERKKTQR